MKTKIIASLIATAFVAGIAHAATMWYWTGEGGDANWFTAANWNTAADGSGNDATELASGDSFTFGADAPAEITYNPSAADFAVGTVTFASGAPSIVVKGDAIAGVSSVTNSSGLAQTFSNAVAFASTATVSGSSAASPVTFAGGATATKPTAGTCLSGQWTLTPGGTWQLGNNSYTALSGSHIVVNGSVEANNSDANKNGRFTVNEGAKLEITGNFWARPSANSNWKAFETINGTVDIKGTFEMSSWYAYSSTQKKYTQTSWGWPTIAAGGNGTLAVGKTMSWTVPISGQKALSFGVKRLVCGSNWTWKLGTDNNVGLNFPNDFEFRAGGDFTLPGITGNQSGTLAGKSFHFNTTDFYDGETGRTIVISGIISSQKANSEKGFSAFGNGTVVFNCDYTNFTGGFTASNGVRVVLASNRRPGQNPVTMKEGTTLAVTNSVTTGAIGGSGAVTLESGSALAFNFSSTTAAPVLAFNASSTLALPETGSVKVKVTADEGLEFDFGSAYTITSNGKFPDDAVASGKIALSEDSASWVSLSVASGNLVVTKKPFFHITVR